MSNRDRRWLDTVLLVLAIGFALMLLTNGLRDALVLFVSGLLLIVTLYFFGDRN